MDFCGRQSKESITIKHSQKLMIKTDTWGTTNIESVTKVWIKKKIGKTIKADKMSYSSSTKDKMVAQVLSNLAQQQENCINYNKQSQI